MAFKYFISLASLLLIWGGPAFGATTASDIQVWPKGVVPYVIEDNVPAPLRKLILKAIERINSLQIVSFTEQVDPAVETLTVFTYKKGTCSSVIGYREGTSSLVKVSEECTYGKVMHEMFHTLGVLHEQENPSRPFELNFDVLGTAWNDQYLHENTIALTEHDPHSIMHYHSFDNSICGFANEYKWKSLPASRLPDQSCRRTDWQTLRAENNQGVDCWAQCSVFLHPEFGPFGGERAELTELDIEGLRKLYESQGAN